MRWGEGGEGTGRKRKRRENKWEREGERGRGKGKRRGLRRKEREGSETYVAHSLASMDLMMYSPVPRVCVQRVKLKEENQCDMRLT